MERAGRNWVGQFWKARCHVLYLQSQHRSHLACAQSQTQALACSINFPGNVLCSLQINYIFTLCVCVCVCVTHMLLWVHQDQRTISFFFFIGYFLYLHFKCYPGFPPSGKHPITSKEQLSRAVSPLPPCVPWRLTSGHQAEEQVPLPAEPFC